MNLAQELNEVTDFEAARARLAELIHLEEPAPPAVTRRALLDRQFATYLMLTRDSPQLQRQLLDDPRTREFGDESVTAAERSGAANGGAASRANANDAATEFGSGARGVTRRADAAAPTGAQLLGKASRAFLQWGATGFRSADDALREKRWAACQGCDRLVDPPETVMYQGLRLLTGPDTKICSACGCVAQKKVAMPTERCPLQHKDDSMMSRWGEPWRPN